MFFPLNANLIAIAFSANFAQRSVDAHGYLKTPRSRNYVASIDPKWYGGTVDDPAPENCPHCLNIGGTESQCGKVGNHNYDYPPNAVGEGTLSPAIQECYEEGAVIDIESVLTAHHKGHFELKACPVAPGEVPTQACFDSNKLTFVEDKLYGALPDPLYPERAYIPLASATLKEGNGNYKYHHQYKLPDGLRGDLILIQWYYVTANSCAIEGYDTYNFPPGFDPQVGTCTYVAPDGRGLPEQFWNCAEVQITIAGDCDTPRPPSPPTTASPTKGPTLLPTKEPTPTVSTASPVETTTTTTTSTVVTTTGSTSTPNPNCAAHSNQCSANNPCADGACCSQWGYCGVSRDYCGDCCQSGNCWNDPSPPSPSTSPPTPTPPNPPTPPAPGFNYSADHGEDSRLIAYVGNWQTCPTDEQVDAYSHMVIAFAVSYTWDSNQNICDDQCNLASSVPICENQNRQDLVDSWRAKGKKIILSFGGAGMGGSWSGDKNNCWDHCFGKEDQLSTDLTNIVSNQNFDGIDIDYEYCYDTAGKQSGRCLQRTSLYSDEKAQTFLDTLTSKLRVKLDALQVTNEYNRGRYEITHAPMDSDLAPSNGFDSRYFQILKDRRADLDFLMPQFYNGVTRPGIDGVGGAGSGAMSAAALFSSIANDMFDEEPHKVVFGFCISDCSGTGSNISSGSAVQVMSDLKTHNDGEFMCNGGAFFWVANNDINGSWSDGVVGEVSLTAGCSVGGTPAPSTPPTPIQSIPDPTYTPTNSRAPVSGIYSPTFSPSRSPSKAPSTKPTFSSTGVPTTSSPTTSSSDLPTNGPSKITSTTSTTTVTTGATVTTASTTTTMKNTDPNCKGHSNQCSATNPCPNGWCCSQWGYCGRTEAFCGDCCQSGNCWA